MERLHIAFAALLGGIVAAMLGWLESGEAFDGRKFGGSVIRSLVAAAVIAVGFDLSGDVATLDFFYAFLAGAGVDVIGNRLAGSFGNGSFPLSSNSGKDKPEG